MKKELSCLLLVASLFIITKANAKDLEVGSLSVGSRLRFEYSTHKLGDKWDISKAGYKGINYNFKYDAAASTSAAWQSSYGQTLYMDVAFRPFENLSGKVEFEFIGDYADKYWQPVNLEHRLNLDNKSFSWNYADIVYGEDSASVRYFKNVGHYSWVDKGDLFNLYPEQFETQRYLRVSGRGVPEGFQVNLNGSAGNLELIYGQEVIWAYTDGVYANYNFKLFNLKNTFIYTGHVIPYGNPDERMHSYSFSTEYKPLALGVLYQPFRLDKEYTYVEDVGQGNGLLGSKYNKKTGTTGSEDALGYSAKLNLKSLYIFNTMALQYTHLGLVAGNKEEYSAKAIRRVSRFFSGVLDYKYRKPLLGPVPLVYEGTGSNMGPALFEPRGPNSPFWVGYKYIWPNREAEIISFTLTYDPTPKTWFYNYQPDIVDEWNLNPKEDSKFSCAAKYTLTKYPTGTDRLVYNDENGKMSWEGPNATGAWATNDYIGAFNLISKINLSYWKITCDMGVGESLATGSVSYTNETNAAKPITSYFTSGLKIARKSYSANLRYSENIWGPEEWQRDSGNTYDRLYQFDISKGFGDYINIGLEYTGARETDNKYYAIELGDYDEIRASVTLSFGPIVPSFKE